MDYLIMREGHEGVARVDPEILGCVDAENPHEALARFANDNQSVRESNNKYYDVQHPLELHAFIKPEPDDVRPVAYQLWKQDGGSVNDDLYYWGQAEIILGRPRNESSCREWRDGNSR